MNDYANAFHMAAPYWAERGVKTYAYDQRGCGRSVGRGNWPEEELMREDLRTAVALVRVEYPETTLAVVGISMGGMIGQHVASMAPQRVKSLTAIMTTTGNPKLPRPSGNVMKAMVRRGPQPTSRDEIIDQSVSTFGVIGTPGEDQNTNGMRDRITRSYDRSFNPAGVLRQMSAIVASGDFRKHTRSIKSPTLVVHGNADPLVPIEGGHDIAKLVRGARMEIMDGMGHDVPPRFLPQITKLMLDHFDATKVYSAAE